MRGTILLAGLVGLLGVSGCGPARTQIRPPVTKEEFREPPTADSRYVNPPQYPRDVLMKGSAPKLAINENQGPGAGGGAGAGLSRAGQ